MHKGFTLVELSVVLLIIGLLLIVGIKGGEAVTTARINREISIIRYIESATTLYIGKRNDMPDNVSTLIDFNLIGPEQLYSYMSQHAYEIYRCEINGQNIFAEISIGNRICAVIKNAPTKLVCNIERILDDSIPLAGTARPYGTIGSVSDVVDSLANRCRSAEGAKHTYGYIVTR